MSRYAGKTTIDRAGSVAELERLVDRYGATGFGYGREGDSAWVAFKISGFAVRLHAPMPARDSSEFTETPTGRERSAAAAQAEWEQACRARWRAVVLITKAKFEAIEAGISTVEREFLVDLVMPDGRSVGQHVLPAVAASMAGRPVRLLPEGL